MLLAKANFERIINPRAKARGNCNLVLSQTKVKFHSLLPSPVFIYLRVPLLKGIQMKDNVFDIADIGRLSNMQKITNEYRGYYIGIMTALESKIDEFISAYFIPDSSKREDFICSFFSAGGMDLRRKQKLVEYIIDKSFPNFKEKEKFINDLDKVITMRNDLAHSKLLSSVENIRQFDGDVFELFCYSSKLKPKRIKLSYKTLEKKFQEVQALMIQLDWALNNSDPRK